MCAVAKLRNTRFNFELIVVENVAGENGTLSRPARKKH
jgi:hypothetical protein